LIFNDSLKNESAFPKKREGRPSRLGALTQMPWPLFTEGSVEQR
jgi:hypothetical protein